MQELLIQVIVIIGLIVGSFTDIKTREVPDWVNFSLIGIGFAVNVLASLIYGTWSYLINSISGFILCLVLALMMFYTGQWGGGDSKMIMAIGALIGLNIFDINYTSFSLISFLVNILLIGSIYGLIWSVMLSIKNRKKFVKELKKIFSGKKRINLILSSSGLLFILGMVFIQDLLVKISLFLFFMLILLYYLWYFIKIVENTCMFKHVAPDKLTEGDWIAKDIKIKGKLITGPKDLGISRKQINQLLRYYKQGKIKKILIKEGIPFVPSFLLAFIATLIYGNLVFLLLYL